MADGRRDADDRRERRARRNVHARECADRAQRGNRERLRFLRQLVGRPRSGVPVRRHVCVADLLGRRAATVRVRDDLQKARRQVGRGRHAGPELRRRFGRRHAAAGRTVGGRPGLYGRRDGHLPGHDVSGAVVDAGRRARPGGRVEADRRRHARVVGDDRLPGRHVRDVPGREVLREMVDAGRQPERGRRVGEVVTLRRARA
ncbi:Glycosyl hydrolase family protein (fragment) [Burkholderia cenocepacia]